MSIQKVAVIGAGVMGAGIAAHIANAGVPVYLLDRVDDDNPNRNHIADAAIAKLLKTEPAAFMHPNNARLVTPSNVEDHLHWLKEVDWVIEAVIENPDIKRALYHQLEGVCRADTLISSNTSTLPLKLLSQGLPDSFKQRFLITHFFNPPRYMRLLELVSDKTINPNLLTTLHDFADVHLGKGCVDCHDTPGFIANRIGTFWIQSGLLSAIELDITIEQADALMTAVGIPKTGIFGLLDLIGLDLIPHVLASFKQLLPTTDAFHQFGTAPALLQRMISEGYTGRKGKGGFYRLQPLEGRRIKESINLQTGEYQTSVKPAGLKLPKSQAELRQWLSQDDALSRYAWRVLSSTLAYSASLIPEIADDINAIDKAMRLGYNWQHGPFELLDMLGLDWFVGRLTAENQAIPTLLNNRKALYTINAGEKTFVDLAGGYHPIPKAEGVLLLADIKLKSPAILSNPSASLWDIGDGVACLEFHSKMNTLDKDSLNLIRQSIDKVKTEFAALVIHNDAENFSAGANLGLLLQAIHSNDWPAVTELITQGQQTYLQLKYSPFPVVGAPSGLALGGGCEVLLHCDAIQAHAELYIGLVETGVGLIPGWGGCKEYLYRWLHFSKRPGGPMPAIAQAFETIAMAKVSKSAADAKQMLFLSITDGISMNKDRLLADAKAKALALLPGYTPAQPYSYSLPGASAEAALDMAITTLRLAGKITDYDVTIAKQLAGVLSGGGCDIAEPLTESDLLALELKAFLYLVQQPGTLAKLEYMLIR
ncbi:MAG: 3-hydroxyacyl-CoA dehydrogenase NAD-binding domain-containing protein [Methylococcales bacterium]|nr:3-hydroxyacyl-CoA dehydrogenase [Methylococcaceae bacterium]